MIIPLALPAASATLRQGWDSTGSAAAVGLQVSIDLVTPIDGEQKSININAPGPVWPRTRGELREYA